MDSSPIQSEMKSKVVDVEFSGKGGEFFGIWIVNVLLSILTLGIYSAWATVRTKTYFYSNTSIDGHAFSYLATPMQILKGRLLALAFFVVYSLVGQFFPIAGLVFLLVILLLAPWLIVSGLRFGYRMTSYRNVRFDFHGSYGQAFVNFILLPIAALLSLYLALPWVLKKMDEFILSNTRYGDRKLEVNLEVKAYYKASLLVILATLAILAVIAVLLFIVTGSLSLAAVMSGSGALSFNVVFLILYIGLFFLFGLVSAIYRVRIRNHIYNNAEFENIVRFNSTMEILPLAMLKITNTFALIFSLGLAYPWTAIRNARYSAVCTQVQISEEANQVFDTKEEQSSSFGEEASDVFDLDVSIG